MSLLARTLHHVSGRLSLRPPQSESLSRLALALKTAPEILGHERDLSAVLSSVQAAFADKALALKISSGSSLPFASPWPQAWAKRG